MIADVTKKFGGACVGLALAAGAALAASPAVAQPQGYGASVSGVIIHSPHRYAYQPLTGSRVRLDQVSRVVPLGDLDLSTPEGAYVAKRRIERTAWRVCQEVGDLYPSDVSMPNGCYATSVRDALAQTEEAAGYPILAWGY